MDQPIDKSKQNTRKSLLFLTGVIILLLLLYLLAFGSNTISTAIAKDALVIRAASLEPFQEMISVDGTVEPVRSVIIDAVIGGKVKSRLVENGADVRKGDRIIELENSDLQLDILNKETAVLDLINNIARTRDQLEQNKIDRLDQLADAEYQLKEAIRKKSVNIDLFRKGVIPEQEYLEAINAAEHFTRKQELLKKAVESDSIAGITQIVQMRTSLVQAEKNLRLMKDKLLDLVVRAPIDGQLSSFTSEEGQLIDKGDNVGQIDVLDQLKIRVQIDEHYNASTAVGQSGKLEVSGKEFAMEVKRIFPTVQNNFFSADLHFVDWIPDGLKRGQNVRVKLEMSNEREAIVIPRGSFFQSTGGQWVYVLDSDGTRARKRPIRLGKQNPYFYEVLEGLEPGMEVIVSSYNGFDDYEILEIKYNES
jgi:HlyD family secretion protein